MRLQQDNLFQERKYGKFLLIGNKIPVQMFLPLVFSFVIQMSSAPKNSLGSRVRRLRLEKGWSQSDLAGRLPDVRQQSIDQLEQDKVVRPRFLPELAKILGTTPEWLLSGEGNREPAQKAQTNMKLLRDIIHVVGQVLQERKQTVSAEITSRLIATIYEEVVHDETQSPEELKKLASNLVRYEQLG